MNTSILKITSNPDSAIPVIFLAEGFLESQLPTFDMYVQHAIDVITATEPFTTNIAKFNFYKSRIISKEAGVTTRAHVTTTVPTNIKDTYFKVFKNLVGLARYYGIPDLNRQELFKDLGAEGKIFEGRPFYPVIIVNNAEYGGGAELKGLKPSPKNPDLMSVACIPLSTSVSLFKTTFIHEFGHSFGDLDDEYLDDEYAAKAKYYEPDTWYHSNRLNVKDSNPGGWFQGARYDPNKWRPTSTSIMRDAGQTSFGAYNIALLQARIDEDSSYTDYKL
jgi:hypothetical protein